MTTHQTRKTGLLAATLLAAAIGIAAQAAEQPGEPYKGHPDGMREGMQMKHALDELHQQLGLDKNQEALFQSAREASQKAMREGMQSRRANRAKMKEALSAPDPDLRALAAQMDKQRDEHMQQHRQVREDWLKFYDALNPAQKEKARHFIVARMDRMEHGMKERRAGMHHERGGPPPTGNGPEPR